MSGLIFGDATMQVYKAASTSGDGTDDLWFEGILANTTRDKQGEAFTVNALREVAAAINRVPLDVVNDTHRPGIDNVAGQLPFAEVRSRPDQGHDLFVKGYLFGDDAANHKTHRLMGLGKVGFSVGGPLKYAYKAWEGGIETRYIDSMIPDHALACRKGKAIGEDTWAAPIAKAIEEDEEDMIVKAASVSEAKWNGKRSDLPKAAYLMPAGNWDDCKLPVYEPDTASLQDADGHYTKRGPLNANAVRAALAAIGGARTGAPMDVPAQVREKLHRLAATAGIDVAKSIEEAMMDDEPMPVEVVAICNEPPEPSPVFAENAHCTTAAERFEEVAEPLNALMGQLSMTVRGVCGIAEGAGRTAALAQALDDFAATAKASLSAEVAKAANDDADPSATADGLSGAQDDEEVTMPEDTDVTTVEGGEAASAAAAPQAGEPETTDAGAAAPAEPEAVETAPEAVETAEEQPDVAKAFEVVTQLQAQIADLRDQLEVLKAAPAEGGPAAKPSGDQQPGDVRVDPLEEVRKAQVDAADAHDIRSWSRLEAAKIVTGN